MSRFFFYIVLVVATALHIGVNAHPAASHPKRAVALSSPSHPHQERQVSSINTTNGTITLVNGTVFNIPTSTVNGTAPAGIPTDASLGDFINALTTGFIGIFNRLR